ncbi:MAG: hypothetical protein PHV28_18160, partial [Kiritimatiellae bacterium]|nr:hypothetical protein [Kiritimatiellia bacterium]
METVLASVIILAFVTLSTAAEYFWDDGGADGKWSTGANWYSTESDNTPPQGDDTANIGSSTAGMTLVATGVVDQAGAVANQVKIGYNTGAKGTLVIAGGTLEATDRIEVGVSGLGRLVLSNGIVCATNSITVATQVDRPGGSIELEGGQMQTFYLYVGNNALGTMAQNGGTNRIIKRAYINYNAAGRGTYELGGGLFNPAIMDVGVSGTGTMVQTGGVLESPGQVTLGDKSNSVGQYRLENGSLISYSLYVGNYGHGVFTQTGGTNTVGNFLVVPRYQTGVYNLWGGVLMIGTNGSSTSYICPGFDGVEGAFNFGTTNSSGVIAQAPGSTKSSIYIGYFASGRGTFRGWGLSELTGSVRNNGKVVADGYGTDRDLDFSRMAGLQANSLTNAGSNGWYAQDHGRLLLPPVTAGNPVYWGEVNNQDLVNSVKMELTGTGSVTGALLAADHTLVNPDLYKPIGVWEFSCDSGVTGGQLTFLYDAAQLAAMEIDESRLRVWRHSGASWVNVTDTGG